MAQLELKRKNTNYDEQLLSFEENLKYYDVEVTLGEDRIPMHSVVLAANCDFFRLHFLSTPRAPDRITLEGLDSNITKRMLEYCYSGKLKFGQDDLLNVLRVAQFLMVTDIIGWCYEYLKKNLTVDNCINIVGSTSALDLVDLQTSCMTFLRGKFEELANSKSYVKLNSMQLDFILNSNTDNRPNKDVLSLIVNWIEHDYDNRLKYLNQFLDYVDLAFVSLEAFESQCKSGSNCFKVINKIKEKKAEKCNEETLLVVGGLNPINVVNIEIYNMASQTWVDKKIEKNNKFEFSSAFIQNKLLIIGGRNRNNEALKDVDSYDVKTMKRTTLASMNHAKYAFSCVSLNGNVYAIGGAGLKSKPLAYTEMYDPSKNEWTMLDPMPTARYHHGLAVLNNAIYAIGGLSGTEKRFNVNERYSFSTEKWKKFAPMNDVRAGLGVASIDGFIYAVGGFDGKTRFETVERYDPTSDSWTYIHHMNMNSPLAGLSAVNYCGNLIIIGGRINKKTTVKSFERYNFKKKQWISLPSIKTERSNHHVILVSQNVLN